MQEILVQVGGGYRVLVGAALLPEAGGEIRTLLPESQKVMVVADDNVAPLYASQLLESLAGAGLETQLWQFPAGEAAKTGETYLALLEALARWEVGRGDALVALGGGVTGDLTGFAAASYLRGVAYVQMPTSLLAMVDSSVGGKTGIDLAAGKNLAGAFHQPRLVLCDTDTLNTLPDVAFADGCAEVIKYGMLGSRALLHTLAQGSFRKAPEEVILHCIAIKRDIVQRDELDRGERQLLNFGHTFGHGLEACSGYGISHGRAVAVGMCLVTRAAVRQGLCPPECLRVLEALLRQYDLPLEAEISSEDLCRAAMQDKKRMGADIQLVIPIEFGRCGLHRVPVAQLSDWTEGGRL